MLTNAQFATQLASIIAQQVAGSLTQSASATQITNLLNTWSGLQTSNPGLAATMAQCLALWQATPNEYATWASGTATGGYHADGTPSSGPGDTQAGYYPITTPGGTQVFIPCPAVAAVPSAPSIASSLAGNSSALTTLWNAFVSAGKLTNELAT